MKKKSILLTGLCALILITCGRMSDVNMPLAAHSPSGQWSTVDSLDSKGLYRSSRDVVSTIYAQAEAAGDAQEMYKSICYLLRYDDLLDEDNEQKGIERLQKVVVSGKGIIVPMAHGLMAQVYWGRYQREQYKILQRTSGGVITDDMSTWDAKTYVDLVDYHYRKSLDQVKLLKQTKTASLDSELLTTTDNIALRPTLYDLLAAKALQFYTNSQAGLTRPVDVFVVQKAHLGVANDFIALELETVDSLSFDFRALQLYQGLLANSTPESDAFHHTNLERLNFAQSRFGASENVTPGEEKTLMRTLSAHLNETSGTTAALYSHRIAQLLMQEADKYSEGKSPEYADHYLKAVALCEQAMADAPQSRGATLCNQLLTEIDQEILSVIIEEVVSTQEPLLIRQSYRNIDEVYLKIVSVDTPRDLGKRSRDYTPPTEVVAELLKETTVANWSAELPSADDHHQHSTELIGQGLPAGRYALLVSNSDDFDVSGHLVAYQYFWVTDMMVSRRAHPDGRLELTITDRDRGLPISGVEIRRYFTTNYRDNDRRSEGPLVTDSQGRLYFDWSERQYDQWYTAEMGDQRYGFSTYAQAPDSKPTERTSAHLFTDRSIYRPGQELFFKALVIASRELDHEIVTDYPLKVTLRDANNQEVSTLDLQTNDYGSCDGSFTLPSSGLSGQMSLVTPHGRIYFSVEEYKRPTFSVEMLPLQGEYSLGKQATATGQAMGFNGAPITDAKVRYTVDRKAVYRWYWGCWWRPRPANPQVVITKGTTTTDEQGRFTIDFEALGTALDQRDLQYYTFDIKADVVDLNGETRSGSSSINIGKTPLLIAHDALERVALDKLKPVFISTTNLNGESTPTKGRWEIRRLKDELKAVKGRHWSAPEFMTIEESTFRRSFPHIIAEPESEPTAPQYQKVLEGEWNDAAQSEIQPTDLVRLGVGRYLLVMTAEGAKGDSIESEAAMTIFGPSDGPAVIDMPLEVIADKQTYLPGEEAEVVISGLWPEMSVELLIEHNGQVVNREMIDLDKSQRLIRLPIKKEYQRGGLTVHCRANRAGRAFVKSLPLSVSPIDYELDVRLTTFRDRLMPGQTEEWRLNVSPKNGQKAISELLLSMYDASLDAFRPHQWSLALNQGRGSRLGSSPLGIRGISLQTVGAIYRGNGYIEPLYLPMMQTFGYSTYGNSYYYEDDFASGNGTRRARIMKSAAPQMDGEASAMEFSSVDNARADLAMADTAESVAEPSGDDVSAADTEVSPTPSIRRDFKETAFFYPTLYTDKEGGLTFSFTIPESLTSWKFQALAHTAALQIGSATTEVVTQKDLMVMPNMPRFLRQGDRLRLSTKVTVLAEETLSGTVRLELYDALTMAPLTGFESRPQTFAVSSGSSKAFDWEVSIPESASAILYRFVAESPDHSDGEEGVLPVLSDRMLVHESMPFSLDKQTSGTFSFERMEELRKSTTLQEKSLTLEFTGNPVWYAVQAMPYMMEYPHDCSEQIFTRYYANALAMDIIVKRPRLKEVFARWKQLSPESLISNLEQNQELKYVLLEETPWVMEAQDETERKKRLGLLLDLDHMADRQSSALQKLERNQLPNGAWPWFNGMRENLYITQHIVSGLGHLKQLGALDDQPTIDRMINKAVSYLDKEHLRRYQEMKRRNTDMTSDHTSSLQIQYLYARSFFLDIPVRDDEAYVYHLGQAGEFWLDDSIYLQGFNALVQHRNKKPGIAADIMKSLRERATIKAEIGMYWKDYRPSWRWSEPGVEKHALMVEAFSEVAKDEKAVYELKKWLLANKRTNDWGTTKATTEACYALLIGGQDWTADRDYSVTIAGETFSNANGASRTAGIGYIKKSWAGSKITTEMSTVSVTKEGEVPVWGALHWSYLEQMDKVTQSDSPLQISRKIYKVNDGDTGQVLELATEVAPLVVGDRVRVQISLSTDRAMDYVHLKDMRAAALEPIDVLSGMVYEGGLGFYKSTRDVSTDYFIDQLPKGEYVLEYDLFVQQAGSFSNGISTIQCMYAPEFNSHSEGLRLAVDQK